MSITAKKLNDLVSAAKEANDTDDHDGYSVWDNYSSIWVGIKYEDVKFPVVLSDDVSIIGMEAEGGGEGQGDEYWVVARVQTSDGVQLFRVDGWYQSYSGGELDGDPYEVVPVEKTITIYKEKN